LPDFIQFRLTTNQGQYVHGFGKAYKLIGQGFLVLEYLIQVVRVHLVGAFLV